eukprot:1090414-Pelagomonas_calceolata.AAC.2
MCQVIKRWEYCNVKSTGKSRANLHTPAACASRGLCWQGQCARSKLGVTSTFAVVRLPNFDKKCVLYPVLAVVCVVLVLFLIIATGESTLKAGPVGTVKAETPPHPFSMNTAAHSYC